MATEMILATETGLKVHLQVPVSSAKESIGWNVFNKAYAIWCKTSAAKEAGIIYNAKEAGMMWKHLSKEDQAIWKQAGRISPSSDDGEIPAKKPKSSSHFNCSSFFHKIVIQWCNPMKVKGQTIDMIGRSEMWKADPESKSYWKAVMSVWVDEDQPTDLTGFLSTHPEYVAKLEELRKKAMC